MEAFYTPTPGQTPDPSAYTVAGTRVSRRTGPDNSHNLTIKLRICSHGPTLPSGYEFAP